MDTSRNKQRIRRLCQQIGTLAQTTLPCSPLFAGWLYEQESRCGKVQCKCAKGRYRHRQWCVSFKEDGKSRTRVVSPADRTVVEKMTKDYRRFREARRQIKDIFEELLAAIDAVGEARCKQGRKRYFRLVAKKKEVRSSEHIKREEDN